MAEKLGHAGGPCLAARPRQYGRAEHRASAGGVRTMRNGHAEEIAKLIEPGRVHRRVYADPDVFELEMERIFGRAWLSVAHASKVPEPGDYITTDLGRHPVIMCRHSDGSIRVL